MYKTFFASILVGLVMQAMPATAAGEFTGFPTKTLNLVSEDQDLLSPEVGGRITLLVTCDQNILDIINYGYSECGLITTYAFLSKGSIKIPAAKPHSAVPAKLSKYFITIRLITNSNTSTYDLLDEVRITGKNGVSNFYKNIDTIRVVDNKIVLE